MFRRTRLAALVACALLSAPAALRVPAAPATRPSGPTAAPADPDPATVADVRAAAIDFFEAVFEGRVDAAAGLATFRAEDEWVISAMARNLDSERRLAQALAGRFAEAAPVPLQERVLDALGRAAVSVEGDRAQVAQRAGSEAGVPVRRVGGAWKVDVTELASGVRLLGVLKSADARARATNWVIDGIARDAYTSAEEARAAWVVLIDAAREKQTAPPSGPGQAAGDAAAAGE